MKKSSMLKAEVEIAKMKLGIPVTNRPTLATSGRLRFFGHGSSALSTSRCVSLINRMQTDMNKIDASNSSTVLGAAPPHVLPALPYAKNAFVPAKTAKTVRFHYEKHHKGYVDNQLGTTRSIRIT